MAGGASWLLGCSCVACAVGAGPEYPRRASHRLRDARLESRGRTAMASAAVHHRNVLVPVNRRLDERVAEGTASRDRRDHPKAVCIVRRDRIRARRAAHPGRHPSLAQAVPLWNRGPPPRLVPAGELLLEIHSHPWVTTRRNFRDTEKKRLEDQLNAVIVGFVRMATGLRSHALKEALERRQQARAARRRREEERRRQELERNIAHFQKGMERWQWRQTAKEFLRIVRTEARRRSLDKEAIDEWLAWADAYIDQRGLEGFFDRWRLSEAGASPDAKTRR